MHWHRCRECKSDVVCDAPKPPKFCFLRVQQCTFCWIKAKEAQLNKAHAQKDLYFTLTFPYNGWLNASTQT
jgi:hypothetical protein